MKIREALERAQDEIRTLRAQNEILRAKVEMIDLFAAVLFTQAARQGGGAMHPDIVWEIDRLLREPPKDLEMEEAR